jgi:acetylornithine deacetylase/succinyl-diaminopimelate desuccinylase family protein
MSTLKSKLIYEVESLSKELIKLTRDLVRIPSENPPGDETGVSQKVGEELGMLGFDVEYVEPAPKRVSTLGELKGCGGGKNFLYNGHYDTVPIGNLEFWTVDPYEGIVKDSKVYGRGTGDMKASIASAIIAARALKNVGINLKGDFMIHAVADEETGSSYGTKYLVDKRYETRDKVDMAVVGEGSVFKDRIYIRTAVRGAHWIKIVTRGRSAHASRPEAGVNAVIHMCKILLALNEHKFSFTPHGLLPDPSISVGTLIKGGVKENVIPEMCEAACDLRVVPGMTREETLSEIVDFIRSLKAEDPSIDSKVETIYWWPPSETSTSEDVFKVAGKAVQDVAGYELTSRGTSGSNDTSWLKNVAGIPTVAFGPGDNYKSGAHGPDEWVSIDRLVDFAKIYGLMAMDICGVDE